MTKATDHLSLQTCCVCGYVPSCPHVNSQVHIGTHKPDQTKININLFDMVKSAAQLLYGPVIFYILIH